MYNLGLVEILLVLVGIIYGYLNPGKGDKSKLVKNAVKYGLVLGVLMGILMGEFNLFIITIAVIVCITFTVGAVIGDFLEWKISS